MSQAAVSENNVTDIDIYLGELVFLSLLRLRSIVRLVCSLLNQATAGIWVDRLPAKLPSYDAHLRRL